MVSRARLWGGVLKEHFESNRQMAFVSGPRQVGKTTLARQLATERRHSTYLNWDVPDDRIILLGGASEVAREAGLDQMRGEKTLVVIDEVHKFDAWKPLLKGLFDAYSERSDILVTGSGNLETFRSGGESLMGRYFSYRMHPFSPGGLVDVTPPGPALVRPPSPCEEFDELLKFGGFPEPFLRSDETFHRRWSRLRAQQLLEEDINTLTAIRDLDRLEVLTELLRRQSGELTNYSSLAKQIKMTVDTVTRWLSTLEALYYAFSIRPWYQNVARSLRKQPKYYVWDWSIVRDEGARHETFVASCLLRATHIWTDLGLGEFGLHYLRDKQKNEVDFLVSRDDEPWLLVEVKTSKNRSLSASLVRFADELNVDHALQVAIDADFVEEDCFSLERPMIVPARTFLTQLP